MTSTIVGFLLTTLFLMAMAGRIPSFTIENWGTALAAGIVLSVVGYGSGYISAELSLVDFWRLAGVSLAFNTAAIALAAFLLPGMEIKGVFTLIVVSVLLTFFQLALPTAVAAGAQMLAQGFAVTHIR